MSEPVKQAVVGGAVPMRVVICGRVARMRRYEGNVYTVVTTPAADEYSRPNSVEIRSKSQIGAQGDAVDVSCILGGWSEKPRKWVDRETGEQRTIHNVRMFLDAVE